jgi:hypothetical protein
MTQSPGVVQQTIFCGVHPEPKAEQIGTSAGIKRVQKGSISQTEGLCCTACSKSLEVYFKISALADLVTA